MLKRLFDNAVGLIIPVDGVLWEFPTHNIPQVIVQTWSYRGRIQGAHILVLTKSLHVRSSIVIIYSDHTMRLTTYVLVVIVQRHELRG